MYFIYVLLKWTFSLHTHKRLFLRQKLFLPKQLFFSTLLFRLHKEFARWDAQPYPWFSVKQTRNGKISNPIHVLEKVGLSKWVGIDVFWTFILSSGLMLSRPCLLKYGRFLIELLKSSPFLCVLSFWGLQVPHVLLHIGICALCEICLDTEQNLQCQIGAAVLHRFPEGFQKTSYKA